MTTIPANPHICKPCGIAYRQVPSTRHGDFPTYEPLGYIDELGIREPHGFMVLNGAAPCCGGFLRRRVE